MDKLDPSLLHNEDKTQCRQLEGEIIGQAWIGSAISIAPFVKIISLTIKAVNCRRQCISSIDADFRFLYNMHINKTV